MSLHDGSQCESFACRYAVRCREFRGLKMLLTFNGPRWYCWRHFAQEVQAYLDGNGR